MVPQYNPPSSSRKSVFAIKAFFSPLESSRDEMNNVLDFSVAFL
jgi:hypothetical protein